MMIEETFTDVERHRLIDLILGELNDKDRMLLDILSKILGTDTVLVARRAYRSQALSREQSIRQRASDVYHCSIFPTRNCDREACGRQYTGPSLYCSLECAELDA